MTNFVRGITILLAAAAMAGPLHGQTPDTATLNGEVQDASHAQVPGATVTVTNGLTGLVRSVTADGRGDFTLSGLPTAGSYDVRSEKSGFAPARIEHISLAGGSTARVVVTLSVQANETRVDVEGYAADVRLDQPQLGNFLSATQIQETPLLNRRITYLPLLNAANRPAINQGDVFMNQDLFTTNGAGRRQTWFEVDGGNSNDGWGRQTIFTNIPEDAVEEISVLTNVFSAQYGYGTGSVVNIVTKSGGDTLHGDVLALYRPSGPEAKLSGFTTTNAASGTDIVNDSMAQFAASLGGRLFSDSTHFFAAFEETQQNRASPVTSTLAPGNFIGHYRDLLGFLRIDKQFSPRNNAFFRESDDGFYDTNPNGIVGGQSLATVARTFRRRTYTTEIGDTAILGPRLVNNVRAQFQLGSPITEFDPAVYGTQFVVPLSGVAGATSFTTGTSQNALLLNHQYEVNDVLSATLHRHQLSIGTELIFAHTGGNSKEFGGPIYLGKFTYNTCSQGVTVCESPAYLNNINNVANYQQSFGNAVYTVDDALYAVFAQDDYRVNKKLTVNLGLRYEGQTFTDAHKNFAPRVGFDLDVFGTGKTVVRGGFGIYYSQIVDNQEANYALTGPTGVFNYTALPGQVGFPTTIAAAPIPVFPTGAVAPLRSLYIRPGENSYLNQFFPTSTLVGYPSKLLNPYSEQYTLSVEQRLAREAVLSVDYVGAHALRILRPLDVDAPTSYTSTRIADITKGTQNSDVRSAILTNCSRPYWVAFFAQKGTNCATSAAAQQPPYSVIQSDVNDGFLHYDALDINLRKSFGEKGVMLASYTWSHTMDNVDPDATNQNPNDPNQTGAAEYGNALYDQRNRFVLSGFYTVPLKIRVGGITTMAGGLPYNLTTGLTNSGDTGATTDRPIVNGALAGRNTGRGKAVYYVDPFVERDFHIYERLHLNLRAEAFNVNNHPNFVTFNGVYGTTPLPSTALGTPSVGATAQLPARELQFSAKVSF